MTPAEHIARLDSTWQLLDYVHCGNPLTIAFSPQMKLMEEDAAAFKAEHPEAYDTWIKERPAPDEDDEWDERQLEEEGMAMTALATRAEGSIALEVFGREYDAIKQGIAPNLTDAELDYLASVSRDMGLSVIRKQIYGTKRKAKNADGAWVDSLVIQVGIDGYRVIAQRSGKYAGQLGPYWCGPDGEWRDVWLSQDPPAAAKVAVLREDFNEPLWAVATYAAYCATNKDGHPTGLWVKMPEVMLAKCAEALALRKAFPEEMGGTYTTEEMEQADSPTRAPQPMRAKLAPVADPPVHEEEPPAADAPPARARPVPAKAAPTTPTALTVTDEDGAVIPIPAVSRQHGITKLAQVNAYLVEHGFAGGDKQQIADELENTYSVRISGNIADAYPSALYDIAAALIEGNEEEYGG